MIKQQFVIQVENGYPINYPVSYENFLLLFPECPVEEVPSNDVIGAYGYAVFEVSRPPIPTDFQHQPELSNEYFQENGVWKRKWILRSLSEQEILDKKWERIRFNRNRMLRDTDWTQLSNINILEDEKTAWNQYRQSLRDIPQTFTSPDDVTFPAMPADNFIFREIF